MLGLIFGFIRRIIERSRIRRQIRNINRQNEEGKHVVEYHDAPVETYVSKERIENIIASGNNKYIRDRVSCAAAYNAYKLGNPVIVLHCGNEQLEHMLEDAFSSESGLHIVNGTNKNYDPFLDLDKHQIAQLVLSSANDSCKIQHNGGVYIKGLTDYLLARSNTPCASSYIRCPHDDMWRRVGEHARNGDISQAVAKEINDQISMGLVERGNVEQYFRVLNSQAGCILANREAMNSDSAISIRRAINKNDVIAIDVVSSSNDLLLNVLVQEIRDAMSGGRRFVFILDSIPVDASEALGRLLRNFSNRCKFVYTSYDTYSDTIGTESLFDTLLGKANTVFVTQHDSASSSEKFSKYFGKYQKVEINNTITSGDSYATFDQILPGSSTANVYSMQHVDRPRVEESEITGLEMNRVLIKKEGRNDIISVRCSNGSPVETYSEPRRRQVNAPSTRTFNWGIFILLFIFFYPAAFVYGFITSGRRGKIVFGILTLVGVAFIITTTVLEYSGLLA
ncbi:MAG: hypothetical protein IJ400_04790 [Clostridia bacterium]|nr:hypothetical protein [Clostridia bacterium]